MHSPQVINRNFSKNDWDKQGTKILDPGAGRCTTSWRRELGKYDAICKETELQAVGGVKA
jgi:hypothetical protein